MDDFLWILHVQGINDEECRDQDRKKDMAASHLQNGRSDHLSAMWAMPLKCAQDELQKVQTTKS